MLIPHQANLRFQFIQKKFELSDDKCNNIQKWNGNTASIPIALTEAWGKVKSNQEIP
jgi:3-oxoacyl-[acyl-carrier-protein] synthase III